MNATDTPRPARYTGRHRRPSPVVTAASTAAAVVISLASQVTAK
jgi:hypothetical protein